MRVNRANCTAKITIATTKDDRKVWMDIPARESPLWGEFTKSLNSILRESDVNVLDGLEEAVVEPEVRE